MPAAPLPRRRLPQQTTAPSAAFPVRLRVRQLRRGAHRTAPEQRPGLRSNRLVAEARALLRLRGGRAFLRDGTRGGVASKSKAGRRQGRRGGADGVRSLDKYRKGIREQKRSVKRVQINRGRRGNSRGDKGKGRGQEESSHDNHRKGSGARRRRATIDACVMLYVFLRLCCSRVRLFLSLMMK